MLNMQIKWVIAHEPAYLFYRVAEDFKRLINQNSSDIKIDIEILTNAEYNKKYNPPYPVDRHNLWKLLQDGTVHITQMQTTSLARQSNHDMAVLDLPFLFDNHDQAQNVLEGEVGQYLLNNFDASSKLKGLAFTYSGGFRLMPFKGSVASLSEVMGQPVRSGMSHIAQDTIKAFGMKPVPTEIDEVTAAVNNNQAIGAEHVAQRLYPDQCEQWIETIINTEHSLFLTSIVVNQDWWYSLDSKTQNLFQHCAVEAARNERKLSIEDGIASMNKLKASGVKVRDLSVNETEDLKRRAKIVHDKYDQKYFSKDVLDLLHKSLR